MQEPHRIDSEAALESVLGEPMEFVRGKVVDELDAAMREFIARSPLAFVSTIDAGGHVDVSPKGDPPGFVQVPDSRTLLIPERPGNRLTFGFRNILRNGEIGLIFLVPHQRETLRVKGRASLHGDPEALEAMAVRGKPALMYTQVDICECFFHCGKALIRSKLWQPQAWAAAEGSLGARSFAEAFRGAGADAESVAATEANLEQAYRDELY